MNTIRLSSAAPTTARRVRRLPETPEQRCRRHFLRFFPEGFRDARYVTWERAAKWAAHKRWGEELSEATLRNLCRRGEHAEVVARAIDIAASSRLLFAFDRLALQDAVRGRSGASAFAEGLYELLHGEGEIGDRFDAWCAALGSLPHKRARVLTWPAATLFPFLAQPTAHLLVKPSATLSAAERYGYELDYAPGPSHDTYAEVLRFGKRLRADLRDLGARDLVDVQSFIWVEGSSDYA